jgi:Flp pilus assembly protein TadB
MQSFASLLYFAGLPESYLARVLMRSSLVVLLLGAFVVVLGLPVLLLLAPVCLLLEYVKVKRLAFRRAQEFEKDYPALLLSLAAGVRSGLDPLLALCRSAELFGASSAVRRELLQLQEAIDSGVTEEQALARFGGSISHPDLDLFRAAFMLARKEGSSLGDCLQRLVKVTRQRQSFRRRMRAAVTMQKMSAFGIAGCTIVIGIIQGVTNPKAFELAFESPIGSKALVASLLLIVTGIGWIVAMARARL